MINDTPAHEANKAFHLCVGDGHQIEVAFFGNPNGIPLLVCHGGPGAGLNELVTQFYDNQTYRIILFSQRGCGGSTPKGEVSHNTTSHLITDINKLMSHLGIEKAAFAGDSWGATLALVYAITHPERVLGLLLRGVFLARNTDLAWIYGAEGAGAQFYPEQYHAFAKGHTDPLAIISDYYHTLLEGDDLAQFTAAKAWVNWECLLSTHSERAKHGYWLSDNQKIKDIALLETHYFFHHCFIDEGYIFQHIDRLRATPMFIVQGREDLICRFSAVYALSQKAHCELVILNHLGHSAGHQDYVRAVRRSADHLAIKLSKKR